MEKTYFGSYKGYFQSEHDLWVSHGDRCSHCYTIGQTGTGKSTFLHSLAVQDIHHGKAVVVIDPHGTLAQKVAASVPKDRIKDVIYVDAGDTARPIGINPLFGSDRLSGDERAKRAGYTVWALKGVYGDSWGPELERVLMASVLALMDAPGVRPTLLSVLQLIEDEGFREIVAEKIENRAAWLYFNDTLTRYRKGEFEQKSSSTSNKIFQIAANPVIANMLGQYRPSFSFKDALLEKKILIFNLNQTALGPVHCDLACALIASEAIIGAIDRTKNTEKTGNDGSIEYDVDPCYMHIDEFHRSYSMVFSSVLSEARKYKLGLTLAHQFMDQVDKRILDAVLGNCGTSVMFRVSGKDAALLAEHTTDRKPEMFNDLQRGQAIIQSLKDGNPFDYGYSNIQPFGYYSDRRSELVRNVSRHQYGRVREKVEAAITRELSIGRSQRTKALTIGDNSNQKEQLNQTVNNHMTFIQNNLK